MAKTESLFIQHNIEHNNITFLYILNTVKGKPSVIISKVNKHTTMSVMTTNTSISYCKSDSKEVNIILNVCVKIIFLEFLLVGLLNVTRAVSSFYITSGNVIIIMRDRLTCT